MDNKEISEYMASLGRKTSEDKASASRKNGARPCHKGKHRGRPKGPLKIKPPKPDTTEQDFERFVI